MLGYRSDEPFEQEHIVTTPYGTVDLDTTTSHAMQWRSRAELYLNSVGKYDAVLTDRVCDSDPPRSTNSTNTSL